MGALNITNGINDLYFNAHKAIGGWKHNKGETIFHQKKWSITNTMVHSKLKSWWHPLTILNKSKNFYGSGFFPKKKILSCIYY